MVEYRLLGRSRISVSSICLGTMTWGQQNTEADGHAQLDYALEQGINFIDTAEMYSVPPKPETQGSTEKIIGTWLKARGQRDKVVLATKVSGRSENPYIRPHSRHTELNRQQITYALEGSLKRLQTDYIDLYQLHWPDRPLPLFGAGGTIYKEPPPPQTPENPIEETLAILNDFVKQGKIREIGLSNETAWGTLRFIHASEQGRGPRMVSIQNAYNLINRTFEVSQAEIATRESVGLLAYSPLAQGYLTGKYQNGARPAGSRSVLFNRGQRYEKPGVTEAIDKYVALAKEAGLDPAQMALAFVTSRPFVTSNIIGATTMDQLKIDIGSQNVTISKELEDKIDEIHQVHSNPAP
jgi:aryl-alcohol dehydrogenase-like predicted oxidoreductase